jgi:oligopeptide transport system substrate-binding protein
MGVMKRFPRTVLCICLFAMCSLAAFANGTGEKAAGAGEKVLYLPALSEFDNLDPRVLTSTGHALVQFGIFEPLVRSHEGKTMPGMAKSWEISKDGITYTFRLRDAKWSDGKAVTGGDFVHAFVRMFKVCPASPIYDDIKNGAELRAGKVGPEELGVKAPDDKTVVITLKNPVPYFLDLIGISFGSPGREDLVAKYGDGYGASAESLASCGPFILTEWKREDKVVMVKNPDYWNAAAIKVDKVVVYVLPNQQTQRNMFDNGELSWYEPRSEAEAKDYEAKGQLVRYDRGGIRDLQLNRHGQNDPVKAKILSNPNFMKALSYAIDRQGFIDKVLQGAAIAATVQTPPATSVYSGKNWGQVSKNLGKYHPKTADMAKSKAFMDLVLKDMGYTSVDQLPTFDFMTTVSPDDPKDVTGYILSVFKDMGLKINVILTTGQQFYNNLYKPALAWDIVRAGWGPDYNDPATYMGYWTTASTDMGVTYENAEFDALLDKANKETDLVKRAVILNQAEALFSDNAPCIPILWNKGTLALQKNVKGVTTALSGLSPDYIYADIVK